MPLDVLISGGGIAGPALAYWLVRQGNTVTIVERSPTLRGGGQAVDFRGPVLEVLDKMGVLDTVRANATGMGPMVLVDAHGKEVARVPPEVISGELEIVWGDLARILYDAVCEDVQYRFGAQITGLDDDGHGVTATFGSGDSGHYDLVIGADGLHSGVRALVFGPEDRFVTQLGRYFGFFAMDNHLRLDHCTVAMDTRAVAIQATAPDQPARAMLWLTDPELDFDYRDTARNKQIFAERFADLGWETPTILRSLVAADEVYFDSLAQVHTDSYARGRVCLVGDAAWCASPRSGMGTSLALVGAYVLAHELRASVDNSEESYEAAFGRYQQLLTPYVARCQKQAIDSLKLDGSNGPLANVLRRLALLSLRLPGVARLVARQSLAVGRSFTLPAY